MHGKKVLTVQISPMEVLATMVFTLNSLDDALKLIAQRCYN